MHVRMYVHMYALICVYVRSYVCMHHDAFMYTLSWYVQYCTETTSHKLAI